MEALVVLAIVVVGAAAFVALGAFLTRSGEQVELTRPRELPRRRRSHVVGGLLVLVAGGLLTLVSCGGWVTNGYAVCENSHKSGWWPLESRGSAVVVTSSVLEFESGTGGLLCGGERLLRVQARARPSGRKPVFLGVAGEAAIRRHLGARRYEIAASYFSLLKLRRVGRSVRRLAPPEDLPFWRSSAVFPVRGADRQERMAHEWTAVGAEPFAGRRFGTPPAERFWLVAMNADGSPGVAADLRYEVGLAPSAGSAWLFGIAAGIGLAVTGIVSAVRRPPESSAMR